jgi:uncharacterized membrane protein YpjA
VNLTFRGNVLRIKQLELKILRLKPFIIILLILNFLGAFIGFLYYVDVIGLTQYSPLLWILIPDCPMAVLLLLGVYFQFDKQRFYNYNFFVYIQGIRAAIFTFLIVSHFESLNVELVILGHILLFVQAVAIIPLLIGMEFSRKIIIPIGITIFNDITDFFGFVGIIEPTLAQLPTIQPLFSFFVVVIFGLDIMLILFGIGFIRFMRQEA